MRIWIRNPVYIPTPPQKKGMEKLKGSTCREACRILGEEQEGAEPGQLLQDFTRPQELTLCRRLGHFFSQKQWNFGRVKTF